MYRSCTRDLRSVNLLVEPMKSQLPFERTGIIVKGTSYWSLVTGRARVRVEVCGQGL